MKAGSGYLIQMFGITFVMVVLYVEDGQVLERKALKKETTAVLIIANHAGRN